MTYFRTGCNTCKSAISLNIRKGHNNASRATGDNKLLVMNNNKQKDSLPQSSYVFLCNCNEYQMMMIMMILIEVQRSDVDDDNADKPMNIKDMNEWGGGGTINWGVPVSLHRNQVY